jgi:hypothetical protein
MHHIKEYFVCIVILANLSYLVEKEIKVACVIAKSVVAGCCEIGCPSDSLIFVTEQPFRLFASYSFIEARGKINRGLYAELMRGSYLLAQKVEMKSGMHLVCFGGVICPTVVAFGEKRYRIHMAHFKASLELLAGKFSAYVFYILTRMKIEMYLSESHLNTSQIN